MARIELDRVNLTFQVRKHREKMTLKEYLIRGMFLRREETTMEVQALRDITLSFPAGRRVGVLGHNGAGKSTLLKLMGGIYEPTRGHCLVEGKISSLFDLMLGFDPEASGWDNIRDRVYLQGETPRSIAGKIDAIAAFTELGDFLDIPVRYYSAGMVVRLGFAIATAIEPEILLVDEVLGAGDAAFQEKARRRMLEMMERAELIVVVSHDLKSLARMCDHGVWMDHGSVRLVGPIDEVIEAYQRSVGVQPEKLPMESTPAERAQKKKGGKVRRIPR